MQLLDGDAEFFAQGDLGLPSRDILATLVAQNFWTQNSITLFGRTHLQPRLIAWVGDPGCVYRYSGLRLEPSGWTPLLAALRTKMEALSKARFNSVLLNYYRDGADSMGMHADDEPELGPQPIIASLSLGATRTLVFKSRIDQTAVPVRLPVTDGSVLVMRGNAQAHWKHGIPKTRRPVGPRINLTFRWIHNQPAALSEYNAG